MIRPMSPRSEATGPDEAPRADHHVADDRRRGVDERRGVNDGPDAFERVAGHGVYASTGAAAGTGMRLCTTRNRLQTNAASQRVALPEGLAPETWKSLNAAAWLT